MIEQKFKLQDINLKNFYGENNKHFKLLQDNFPNLTITGRDQNITVRGEEKELNEFSSVLNAIILYLNKFETIHNRDIENIITQRRKVEEVEAQQIILQGANGKRIKARTQNQQKLVELIQKNDMVFALGPAGTGKTYTSVALAVKALKEKQVQRIILTRPAVEAGENLGFLPGDLKEKLDPFLMPLYDALRDMLSPTKLENLMEKGVIEVAPLAFMRGRTLDNAFVILDEAQNTTPSQMKMFLTRMGEKAKFIITGDPSQLDLPRKQKSGLKDAIEVIQGIPSIGFVYLDESDVVRHRLVGEILKAYRKNSD